MDDELVRRLRTDPDDVVPSELLESARAAFAWRTPEVDLCTPSYDSLLDEGLTTVRGEHDARLLSFVAEPLALDLEVSTTGATRRLVGQVTPGSEVAVTVRQGNGAQIDAVSDELGRFLITEVTPGPLSLRCSPTQGDHELYTDWVLV